MDGIKITVNVNVLKENLERLKRCGKGRDLWANAAQVLRRDSMKCFEQQRAPDGTPWKPLKDATLIARAERVTARYKTHGKWYKKAYSGVLKTGKILLDTGRLRASVSTQYNADSAMVGSNLNYAKKQQYGSKKEHIPARPFIGLSADGHRLIEQMVRDKIRKAMEGR